MKNENVQLITFVDFIGGACSGITQVMVGQPLDTVKVRQQTACSSKSASSVINEIMKKEGIKAFYKGTTSPLIGMAFCISCQFAGFNFGQRLISNLKYDGNLSSLQIQDNILAGVFSGICYSWIASPMDLLRIRMQVKNSSKLIFKSPLSIAFYIYKKNGIKGIYNGYTICTINEMLGSAIYFGVYETCIYSVINKYNNNRDEIPKWRVLIYGGLSGLSLWTFIFPLDVLKSRIQGESKIEKGFAKYFKAFKKIYKEKGISGFSSGLLTCQSRAVIVNSCSFVVYEYVYNYLTRMKNK